MFFIFKRKKIDKLLFIVIDTKSLVFLTFLILLDSSERTELSSLLLLLFFNEEILRVKLQEEYIGHVVKIVGGLCD